ncbi:MAG: AN1-type zinc finger domain-containing protein [Candidatus Caldarchaeum sp.]
MTRCHVCGAEELLPFRCSYCSGLFCPEHRLPEKHGCGGVRLARNPAELTVRSYEASRMVSDRGYRASPYNELFSMFVACSTVCLSGLSLLGWPPLQSPPMLLLVFGFAASFIGHELAHKITAVRRGLSASFKLFMPGLFATLLTAILPVPFKVIMPGAVVVAGRQTFHDLGLIALAGPAFNMASAAAFIVLSRVLGSWLLDVLAAVNSFMAFFNLFPIYPLDGEKVLRWSRVLWAVCFSLSTALFLLMRL